MQEGSVKILFFSSFNAKILKRLKKVPPFSEIDVTPFDRLEKKHFFFVCFKLITFKYQNFEQV